MLGEISCNNYKFFIAAVYDKPKADKLDLVDNFDNFLNDKSANKTPFIFSGDFNINILEQNLLTKDYSSAIISNGFENGPMEPTRVRETSSTCLDHYIFQNKSKSKVIVLKNEEIAVHYPTMFH